MLFNQSETTSDATKIRPITTWRVNSPAPLGENLHKCKYRARQRVVHGSPRRTPPERRPAGSCARPMPDWPRLALGPRKGGLAGGLPPHGGRRSGRGRGPPARAPPGWAWPWQGEPGARGRARAPATAAKTFPRRLPSRGAGCRLGHRAWGWKMRRCDPACGPGRCGPGWAGQADGRRGLSEARAPAGGVSAPGGSSVAAPLLGQVARGGVGGKGPPARELQLTGPPPPFLRVPSR